MLERRGRERVKERRNGWAEKRSCGLWTKWEWRIRTTGSLDGCMINQERVTRIPRWTPSLSLPLCCLILYGLTLLLSFFLASSPCVTRLWLWWEETTPPAILTSVPRSFLPVLVPNGRYQRSAQWDLTIGSHDTHNSPFVSFLFFPSSLFTTPPTPSLLTLMPSRSLTPCLSYCQTQPPTHRQNTNTYSKSHTVILGAQQQH